MVCSESSNGMSGSVRAVVVVSNAPLVQLGRGTVRDAADWSEAEWATEQLPRLLFAPLNLAVKADVFRLEPRGCSAVIYVEGESRGLLLPGRVPTCARGGWEDYCLIKILWASHSLLQLWDKEGTCRILWIPLGAACGENMKWRVCQSECEGKEWRGGRFRKRRRHTRTVQITFS